jgi:Fe-S cluster biogenesis protein NfuA
VDEAAIAASRQAAGATGSVEQRIQDILDTEIRPAVAQDGGDITLDRFEDGLVYLHMKGSCSGCPSSTATLKMGIEGRLRELIPEVLEVVAV